MAVACLTRSAVLDGFRTLGAREGLPALPDSELALFTGKRGQSPLLRQLAGVVRDYFSSADTRPHQTVLAERHL
jgi:hypothetical protein